MEKSKKKKIVYLITKSNWGGAQRYVYDLATNAQKDSTEVVVYCGGSGLLKKRLTHSGITTHTVPHLSRDVQFFNEPLVFFHILKILKSERPDVLHLNSSKIGALGALAGRLMWVPKIIFTAHGWAHNEDRNVIENTIIKTIGTLTVLFSHKVIVVSNFDKHSTPPLVQKEKIILIHNGIENVPIKEREVARKKVIGAKNIGDNFLWACTISELHKNKGLKFIIKAVSQLKNKNIVFFIFGEGEERESLEELIKKESLQNTIFLLGRIENAATYLKAFDVFTLTSIKEGLPYVLLEAGFAGLPVIAAEVGGIPDIAVHNKTGLLVEAKNVEQISSALANLIENKEKRELLGKNLQKKIESEFRLETMLKKTFSLYLD